MQTTFPNCCSNMLPSALPHRPCAKEYGIWQAHNWSALAVLVERLAAGLHQAGLSAASMVVIGANFARACMPPCWRCSRWAEFRYRCTRMQWALMRISAEQR